MYGKSVENRCPWVGRRDSEVTSQLQEKGTSNMGEECGEWLEAMKKPVPPRCRLFPTVHPVNKSFGSFEARLR